MIKDKFFTCCKSFNQSFLLKQYTYMEEKYILQSQIRQKHFEKFSNGNSAIPKILWNYRENKVIQNIEIINASKPIQNSSITKLIEFSKNLDSLRLDVNPHGDINRKNILENDNQLFLVDIEPVVNFKDDGKSFFMSTKPYIHYLDCDSGMVSILSDLVGFGCFSLWYIKKYEKPYLAVNDSSLGNIISLAKDASCFSNLLHTILTE